MEIKELKEQLKRMKEDLRNSTSKVNVADREMGITAIQDEIDERWKELKRVKELLEEVIRMKTCQNLNPYEWEMQLDLVNELLTDFV